MSHELSSALVVYRSRTRQFMFANTTYRMPSWRLRDASFLQHPTGSYAFQPAMVVLKTLVAVRRIGVSRFYDWAKTLDLCLSTFNWAEPAARAIMFSSSNCHPPHRTWFLETVSLLTKGIMSTKLSRNPIGWWWVGWDKGSPLKAKCGDDKATMMLPAKTMSEYALGGRHGCRLDVHTGCSPDPRFYPKGVAFCLVQRSGYFFCVCKI